MSAFAPVIVCGVGRSGTSLLQSMLAAHSGLCLPPETHFFRTYVAPSRRRQTLEKRGPEALIPLLDHDPHYARAGVPSRTLLRPWLEGEREFRLDEVFRHLLEEYAVAERKHLGEDLDAPLRVGDKDPKNIEFLPALHAAYPDAHVLHIVRDPRGVLASRMKAAWSKERPWWVHSMVQNVQWRRGRAQGRALFGDRWLEIRYEDLLAEPDEVLRRVCDHLGIGFDPEMLSFSRAARRLVHASEVSWKKDTFGPLEPDHVDKWRRVLSPAQVAWSEVQCRAAFREHGYTPEAGGGGRRALLALPALLASTAFRVLYAAALWRKS